MFSIKNLLKILTSIFTVFLFGFLSIGISHASANGGLSDPGKVKVTVTNDQTGETTVSVLDPTDTKNGMKINSIQSDNGSKVVGYDVFVPIKIPNSSGVTTLDDSGGSKNEGGVTARLNVSYDVSANREKIQLSRVYGSWTPSSNMYYLTNRTVNAHSGAVHGNSLSKIPTSNTFSYTTGWGYNYFATGQGSPRAWSSAKVNISGMTATHTINLEITFPDR